MYGHKLSRRIRIIVQNLTIAPEREPNVFSVHRRGHRLNDFLHSAIHRVVMQSALEGELKLVASVQAKRSTLLISAHQVEEERMLELFTLGHVVFGNPKVGPLVEILEAELPHGKRSPKSACRSLAACS